MGRVLEKDVKKIEVRGACKLGWHPTDGEIFLFQNQKELQPTCMSMKASLVGSLLKCGARQTHTETESESAFSANG